MTVNPAHEAPGLSDYERERVLWSEDFMNNCAGDQHARLLAYLHGEAPGLLPALDPGKRSHYPEMCGAAAGHIRTLLGIIARQAAQTRADAAELRKLRGQVAEYAAASADVTRAQLADAGITGKELHTGGGLADPATFSLYAAEQSGMLL